MSEAIVCPVCKRPRSTAFPDCPFCDMHYEYKRENASRERISQ